MSSLLLRNEKLVPYNDVEWSALVASGWITWEVYENGLAKMIRVSQ